MHTGSRIDVPTNGAVVGKEVTVAGVAFAGERGVKRVDVSTDDGRTWNPAELKTALGKYTWRLWRYPWMPLRPERYVIKARATDGTGRTETSSYTGPYPNGASGYDVIVVRRS